LFWVKLVAGQSFRCSHRTDVLGHYTVYWKPPCL